MWFIECDLVYRGFEVNDCQISNNECTLNVFEIWTSFRVCPHINLTKYENKKIKLLHEDMIKYINFTMQNNNDTFTIPPYISNVTYSDTTPCKLPLFTNDCNGMEINDTINPIVWVAMTFSCLSGLVFIIMGTVLCISFSLSVLVCVCVCVCVCVKTKMYLRNCAIWKTNDRIFTRPRPHTKHENKQKHIKK